MPEEKFETSYFGERSIGWKNIQHDIRILSTREVYALQEAFSKYSGLRREQFASNSWGFPFIPIPDVSTGFRKIKTAPENVNKSFFGHPIYWIEPKLTERRPREGEQEWCIRMFFLIDALGYWNEKTEFIDFLKLNGYSFEQSQIDTYHLRTDKDSESDAYPLLDEGDLDTPLSDVEKKYNDVRKRCYKIQKEESYKMLVNQAKQYSFAKKALGGNVYDKFATYSDPGSLWDKKFATPLSKLAEVYDRRAETGNQKFSDIQKESRKIQNNLEKVVERYNHATSILELPVKSVIKGNPGGDVRISQIATTMTIANRKDNLRATQYKKIDKAVKEAFGSGITGEGGFDVITEAMSTVYARAWNRLRLAFINFDRFRDGERVFNSTTDMQANFDKLTELGRKKSGRAPGVPMNNSGFSGKRRVNQARRMERILNEDYSRE